MNVWAFLKSFVEDGINFLKYIYAIDVMNVFLEDGMEFLFLKVNPCNRIYEGFEQL